jgi:hypothetical protein
MPNPTNHGRAEVFEPHRPSRGPQGAQTRSRDAECGHGGRVSRDVQPTELDDVLDRLDAGEFDVFVVAKLDRIWRSVVDFGKVMGRPETNGWSISSRS